MNYTILSIDPVAKTFIIEWENGAILNHHIPAAILDGSLSQEEAEALIRAEEPK